MSTQYSLSLGPPTYTVSEVTGAIRETLQNEFQGVWIEGEITEAKLAPSGHWYFSLKDARAKIKCACYKSQAWKLKVKPADGMLVMARGTVDVYEPRGEYQFIVEALQPRGLGELQLAFEQLKKKLAAEGLFERERKRALPPHPRRIGIVTSPSGAVIQDMLQILERRFKGLHIRVYPAQVQGAGSVEQVCEGLEYFSRSDWAEVVIVARGGGSLEDLWTFNEERVARAIAASRAPVISAIGHETDYTIADFVADLRAPTPSAAAELVIGPLEDLLERLRGTEERLTQQLRYGLARASERWHRVGVDRARAVMERRLTRLGQRLDEMEYLMEGWAFRRIAEARTRQRDLEARLVRTDVRLKFGEAHRRLDQADARLAATVAQGIAAARARRQSLEMQLGHLSPVAILERGYAIVQTAEGGVVKSWKEVEMGAGLRVRLAEGRLGVQITEASGE